MTKKIIRFTVRDDIPVLRKVVQQTGLFPDRMLAEMLAPALTGKSDALWMTCALAGVPVGFSYAEPEVLTKGTWNLRALAVEPAHQGRGLGTALVRATETKLRAAGQRLLIVETSGTEAFAPTRRFYDQLEYGEEARLRDFWATGDDKIIFRKALS